MLVVLLTMLSQCLGLLAVSGTSFRALDTCSSGFADPRNGMASLAARSLLDCLDVCSREAACLSVNVCTNVTKGVHCALLLAATDYCSQLQAAPNCKYMTKRCVHGAWDSQTETCQCQRGFAGSACHRLLQDCSEGSDLGLRGVDRNFLIQPLGSPRPFSVFCFFDGGKTIVLRREECSDSLGLFQQTWGSLQGQSGDCNCHCFAGLDNIYHLLRQRSYCLKVHIVFSGQDADTYYDNVTMGNEASRYSLSMEDPYWLYMPLTENGLLPGGNRKFCTLDHDCGGCAANAGHAGWFDDSSIAPCPEARGFGAAPQWPVYRALQNLSVYSWELLPNKPATLT